MPATITNPIPDWLRSASAAGSSASVFDPILVRAVRMLAGLTGANDPQSQVLALMAPTETGPPVRAYKGGYPYDYDTGKAITEFKSRGVPQKGVFDQYVGKKGGYAGFFSDSPDVASRFAGPRGAVHPVDIEPFANPLVIDAKGSHSANLQYADMAKQPHEKAALMEMWDTLRGKNVGNYDGIILKNTADEGTVYVPLHPEQVRSAFASKPPTGKQ